MATRGRRGLPTLVTARTTDGRLIIASLDPHGTDTPLRRALDALTAPPTKETPAP